MGYKAFILTFRIAKARKLRSFRTERKRCNYNYIHHIYE